MLEYIPYFGNFHSETTNYKIKCIFKSINGFNMD